MADEEPKPWTMGLGQWAWIGQAGAMGLVAIIMVWLTWATLDNQKALIAEMKEERAAFREEQRLQREHDSQQTERLRDELRVAIAGLKVTAAELKRP